MYPDAVPVIILGGFLGAGKTTILNHILMSTIGVKVAVMVNDFGSVNIDSQLIKGQTENRIELTSGCICCVMDNGELEEALESVLVDTPDVILIEASGIAEPEDLVRRIILSPNKKINYGGMVYVVDGLNYQETVVKHPRITEHIGLGDLVVITKTEHMSENAVESVKRTLHTHTTSSIVAVKKGELAPELLFDIPENDNNQLSLLEQNDHYHTHLHDAYQTVTFETDKPISFTKLKEFMDTIQDGIYRIKGFVYFGLAGYEQKFTLQSVGKRWDMYIEEWDEKEVPRTTLVVIGISFNEKNILEKLKNIVGEDEQMVDLERYRRA